MNSSRLSEEAIEQVLADLATDIKKIKNSSDREMSSFALQNPYFNYRKRYKSDLEIISRIFTKGEILDVGSSPYHLPFCLKKLGYNVIGVDIDPSILSEFQKKHGIKVVQADIQQKKLPFKNNEFDMIVFCEVFEHLGVNPLGTLRELHRILKPGGLLMLTTPNLYALHKIIRFSLGRSFNNPYEELHKVETFGYMGHIREYSNREIKDLLTRCGFSVQETIFRKFDNFAQHPYLQFLPIKLAAGLLDLAMAIVPSWKPFQVVISKK